jgi:hypothetical protein
MVGWRSAVLKYAEQEAGIGLKHQGQKEEEENKKKTYEEENYINGN